MELNIILMIEKYIFKNARVHSKRTGLIYMKLRMLLQAGIVINVI